MSRAQEIVKRSLLELEGLARQVVSTYKVGQGTKVPINNELPPGEGADVNESKTWMDVEPLYNLIIKFDLNNLGLPVTSKRMLSFVSEARKQYITNLFKNLLSQKYGDLSLEKVNDSIGIIKKWGKWYKGDLEIELERIRLSVSYYHHTIIPLKEKLSSLNFENASSNHQKKLQ